jgi:hypothetical protein
MLAPEEADKAVWHAMRQVRRIVMRRLETGKEAHGRASEMRPINKGQVE